MEKTTTHPHFISVKEAKEMTKRFRDNRKNLLDPKFKPKDKEILPTCETFDRAPFDKVLAREGCVGLRIYLAQGHKEEVRLVIVGVDKNGKDMITPDVPFDSLQSAIRETSDETTATTEEVIENGARCPTQCPPSSDLNP